MQPAFRDLAKYQTKQIIFEKKFKPFDHAPEYFLNLLTFRRRAVEDFCAERSQTTFVNANAGEPSTGLVTQTKKDLEKLELYLGLLENLVPHVESNAEKMKILGAKDELKIKWTSSLSPLSFKLVGPKFFCIDSLRFELAINYYLYAALLRERGHEVVQTDFAEAATIFRKAAGVYDYLSETVLPPLRATLPRERPVEVVPSMSSVMSLICLADAQAVTIRRAEEKGTSAALLSKLHYAVCQILEEVNSLMETTKADLNDVTPRLKDFLAIVSAQYELKSQRYLAEDLRSKENIGAAISVTCEALKKAKKIKFWAKDASMNAEVNSVGELKRKLERENDFVWHQSLPSAEMLPSLEGKSIVTAIVFQPPKPEKWCMVQPS